MSNATEHIIKAGAREAGSQLLGEAALALIERGADPVSVLDLITYMDVEEWWASQGGPMIDDLEGRLRDYHSEHRSDREAP